MLLVIVHLTGGVSESSRTLPSMQSPSPDKILPSEGTWVMSVVFGYGSKGQPLERREGSTNLSNRLSCNAIRGTEYLSWEERDWFWENCIQQYHAYVLSIPQTQQEFTEGWLAGGGDIGLIPYVQSIIECESSWDRYADSNPPYIGLGQWDNSWYSYGGGDIYSPWQQGYNMAIRVIRDRSFGAWPVCSR